MFQFLKQALAQGAVWGGPPQQDARPPGPGPAPSPGAPTTAGVAPPPQAVAQIFGGLGSWFTDQEAIAGALAGQSEGDSARIHNGFSARTGQSLDATLSAELSPDGFAGIFGGAPREVDAASAEAAYQAAAAEVEQLSQAEKQDPRNPVVRRYNDALTLANGLRDPEAQVTDAHAEFSGMVASVEEADRRAAEEAAAGQTHVDPDAAARHAQQEAEQAEVRARAAARGREREAIEQQGAEVRTLARDEAALESQIREAMKAGDTAAEEVAIAALQAKELERQRREEALAVARARLDAEERAEAERERTAQLAKQQADDEALARSQRELAAAQAANAARAAAEEAERRKAGDLEIAARTDEDVAADTAAEEQRRAGMSDSDRELDDLSKQAERDLASATSAYDALDEQARKDPDHPVVRAYHDTLTRANGFKDPDAPVTDTHAEFSGMIVEQTAADRRAEEERRVGEKHIDPEAAGRHAQDEAELAEQRARAEAADRERAAMTGMEDRIRELAREDRELEARVHKMSEHGDAEQEQQAVAELRRVEAERKELEAKLAAARAEVEARQQAEAAAAEAEQARSAAEREAKLDAQRARAAEIETQRAAERAEEDAERQRAADAAIRDQTDQDVAAEQAAEEQKLAGMDPGDRELYLLGKDAERELGERQAALDALSQADRRNPDHPVVRAYHDTLTRANAFRDPEAKVEDADASFRGAVSAEQERVAREEEQRRAGEKQVDPEAAARHAAAEAEQRAQREAAARAEARRQTIEAGERELRELSYQDGVIEQRIARAEADHDDFAVEDFAAKLREIEAARARVEQQIADARAQQQAEEEEAARKAEQLRLDEETRRQAALAQQQAAAAALAARDEELRAGEAAERQRLADQTLAEKTRADEAAARKAEEEALAGMDEGERNLYLAERDKKRELDAAEKALMALPERERTFEHPLMRRYMELNDEYNSFSDPDAPNKSRAHHQDMRSRVEAELEAAMAEERSKPHPDPEAVARRVQEVVSAQARREAMAEEAERLDQAKRR